VPGDVPGEVPQPLARLIGASLDEVRWRWIGPGLWHRPLRIGGAGSLQLLWGAPSARVPEHTHGGSELTLVLRGALIDETGHYGPGDVADLDEDIEHHAPAADAEAGCICVIANERPTRFRGLLARLMQPWHGI
jgi:putative transcriptional regulator